MANPEHLAILGDGSKAWNDWRSDNPDIQPNLRKADLSFSNLRGMNLSNADLAFAKLEGVDLSGAILENASLMSAKLNKANLDNANLANATIRFVTCEAAYFCHANLAYARLNEAYLGGSLFRGASLENSILDDGNLSFANFSQAILNNASLNRASAKESNFQDASLLQVQALGTDFSRADLTGSLLSRDWRINDKTNLEAIQCRFLYIREEDSDGNIRHPKNGFFQESEFRKNFQNTDENKEISLSVNGVLDLFEQLQVLQQQNGNEILSIKSLKHKSKNEVVLALESLESLESVYSNSSSDFYEKQLVSSMNSYILQMKDREIEESKKEKEMYVEIIKSLANPNTFVKMENKVMSNSDSFSNSFNNSNVGSFVNQASDYAQVQSSQNIYSAESKDIVDVAKEIEALLQHFSQTYPTTTTMDKVAVATEVVKAIEKDPSFSGRVRSALKAGAISTFGEVIDHPVLNILLSMFQDWQDTGSK